MRQVLYLLYMLASLCLNCILNFVVVLWFIGKQVAYTCISNCLPLMEQMETQFRWTSHAGLVDFYMMECDELQQYHDSQPLFLFALRSLKCNYKQIVCMEGS